MKKYLLVGDYVFSRHDGDKHFISASRLCELYNLNPRECVFCDSKRPDTYLSNKLVEGYILSEDLITLYPRIDGNYSIIKAVL